MNRRWLPALLVGGVVLAFSLVPLGGGTGGGGGISTIGDVSGGFGTIGGVTVLGLGVDKLLHVVDYAALAFALGYAVRARTPTSLAAVFVAAVAVGGAVELLQGPLPTRATSLWDVIANAVGAALGTAGWWLHERGRGRGD